MGTENRWTDRHAYMYMCIYISIDRFPVQIHQPFPLKTGTQILPGRKDMRMVLQVQGSTQSLIILPFGPQAKRWFLIEDLICKMFTTWKIKKQP